jgi:hypothetical protein
MIQLSLSSTVNFIETLTLWANPLSIWIRKVVYESEYSNIAHSQEQSSKDTAHLGSNLKEVYMPINRSTYLLFALLMVLTELIYVGHTGQILMKLTKCTGIYRQRK